MTIVPEPPHTCQGLGYNYSFVADKTLVFEEIYTSFRMYYEWGGSYIRYNRTFPILYAIVILNEATVAEFNLTNTANTDVNHRLDWSVSDVDYIETCYNDADPVATYPDKSLVPTYRWKHCNYAENATDDDGSRISTYVNGVPLQTTTFATYPDGSLVPTYSDNGHTVTFLSGDTDADSSLILTYNGGVPMQTTPKPIYPDGSPVPTDASGSTITVESGATDADGSFVSTYNGGVPVQTTKIPHSTSHTTTISTFTLPEEGEFFEAFTMTSKGKAAEPERMTIPTTSRVTGVVAPVTMTYATGNYAATMVSHTQVVKTSTRPATTSPTVTVVSAVSSTDEGTTTHTPLTSGLFTTSEMRTSTSTSETDAPSQGSSTTSTPTTSPNCGVCGTFGIRQDQSFAERIVEPFNFRKRCEYVRRITFTNAYHRVAGRGRQLCSFSEFAGHEGWCSALELAMFVMILALV